MSSSIWSSVRKQSWMIARSRRRPSARVQFGGVGRLAGREEAFAQDELRDVHGCDSGKGVPLEMTPAAPFPE